MTSHDPDDFDPKRRRLMQSALGVGVLGGTAGVGQAYALGGGGGDDGGGGGDGPDPGDDRNPWVAVTLVTGQTVYVSDDGDDAPGDGDAAGTRRGDAEDPRRQDGDGPAADENAGDGADDERVIVVDDDVDGTLHVVERERGVYVIPADVDLDVYSEELFNVDRLLADGLSDEETDAIPVVVRTAADLPDGGADVRAQAGGFEAGTALSSIDAVAGEVRKDRATAAGRGLAAAPAVERIHLDAKYEAVLDESAPAVGAGDARESFGVDGSGVTVGVVDTGVDDDHPDLAGRVVDEADFTGEGTQDDYGHGTHVAGIAAGDGTESDGEYVGVAPGADLVNVKVLGADGSGRTSTIVQGVEHAVEAGVDVINLSLGGPAAVEDDPLVEAVDAAAAAGVLPVVSAGNRYFSAAFESVSSPGVAAGALTVGASDDGENLLFASAAGPTTHDHRVKPDVVAPGVEVTATGSEGAGEYPYTDKTGTSMSAPHVAGAAALLLAARDDWGPDRVRDALTATATVTQDESVYRRGAGRIDVGAALDADVVVRDAVTSFGIYTEPTALSTEIAVENRGDEAVDLDVTADLANVQTGEGYGDAVTATPGTLTVPAGGEATVELAVDAVESYGYNAGEVTVAGPERSYTAVFGFSLGLQFEVERVPLPGRSGAGGAFLQGYTHDGAASYAGGFGDGGVAAFETFEPSHVEDGVEVSFWSLDPHPSADGNVVTVETATIGPENTRVVMDETETVPRYLDTDPVSEHEPFHVELFSESVHANFGDGVTQGYTAFGSIPDADTPTWYTPIDEDSTVNVANRYVLVPEDRQGEAGALDSPAVYNLTYPATAISGPEDPIEVSESTLAADHVSYHRTPAEESLVVTPVTFPRPLEAFPKSIWIGKARTIGADRVEQTVYRSDDTKYEETWYDGSISAENWQAERLSHHRVDPGESFEMQFGRGPLVPELRDWEFADGTLSAETYWYTDQSEPGFNVYHYDRYNLDPEHLNDLLVDVDGDRVIDFQTRVPGAEFGGVTADPGSTVTVTLRGNHMTNIDRATRTEAEYEVTYGSGSNAPPSLRLVEVRGLDAHNRVPAGQLLVLVDVEDHGTGVDTLRAYAAETGTTAGTPFDDPAGWTPAETVYADGSRYGVRVDATGMDAGLDLAVRATDGAGNAVRATTFEGVNTTAGADLTAPVEVRPDAIDPGSNGVVPVVVHPTDALDPHRIDDDTLRFGAPSAVFDGGGAAPHNVQRLGHGALQAQFRANETGYDCDQGLAVGQLVADLDDGTALSGVDVIPTVDCGGT